MRISPVLTITVAATAALAGPLTPPPGAPAPTNKTLRQVEPSTPVDTLPGDATALHIISEPGAYHLTGNIEATNLDRIIQITSTGVSLDLRGFRVRGDATVDAIIESNNISITIRNGTIAGGDDFGLRLNATGHIVEDITFSGAGAFFNQDGVALSVGFGSRVSGCVFTGSGRVTTGDAVLIENCTFTEARNALVLGNGCVARDVTIDGGLDSGPEAVITAESGCMLERVSIVRSFRQAVFAGLHTSIVGCSFTNDSSASSASRAIGVGRGAVVVNTRIDRFGTDGIRVGADSVVAYCTITTLDGTAIGAEGGAVIDRCTLSSVGIGVVGERVIIQDSTFTACQRGALLDTESIVQSSRFTNCVTEGLAVGFGSAVRDCIFRGGSTGVTVAMGDCVIEGNQFDSQPLTVSSSDSVIDGNTFTDPNTGALTVPSAGNLIIRNRFSSTLASVTNIGSGNAVGTFTTNPATAGPCDNLRF